MGNGFPVDIIILAAVAGFLIFRLHSVLGRRTGHERRPGDNATPARPEANDDNVVALPDRSGGPTVPPPPPGSSLEAGLTQIRLADRSFHPGEFVEGAKVAFEMILDAFAKGDQEALTPLLDETVLNNFLRAITQRASTGESLETTLVSMKEAEIVEAEMDGDVAKVTMKFVSEQINVTRDAKGEIVDGGPDQVEEITDLWTFARDTRSGDPNWQLVATRTPEAD